MKNTNVILNKRPLWVTEQKRSLKRGLLVNRTLTLMKYCFICVAICLAYQFRIEIAQLIELQYHNL